MRFGNKRNSQKAPRTVGAWRAFYSFPIESKQSGDVIAAATTNAIWLATVVAVRGPLCFPAVLLPETSLTRARIVAERIRKCIAAQTLRADRVEFKITASIGIAGRLACPVQGLS
jgi:hypothetical protein